MFGLGTTELLVIGGILLLIFGAKKLPEIGKGLGGAIKEFRNVKQDIAPNDAEESSKGKKGSEKPIENKVIEKIVQEVPAVKKGVTIKKKAEKIGKIIK
jgi:sec-independent protein translocase protein TatA